MQRTPHWQHSAQRVKRREVWTSAAVWQEEIPIYGHCQRLARSKSQQCETRTTGQQPASHTPHNRPSDLQQDAERFGCLGFKDRVERANKFREESLGFVAMATPLLHNKVWHSPGGMPVAAPTTCIIWFRGRSYTAHRLIWQFM